MQVGVQEDISVRVNGEDVSIRTQLQENRIVLEHVQIHHHSRYGAARERSTHLSGPQTTLSKLGYCACFRPLSKALNPPVDVALD